MVKEAGIASQNKPKKEGIQMKTTKRLISAFVAICMIMVMIPVTVSAASSGACGDNVTWTLSDDGVLIISGSGPMIMDADQDNWHDNTSSVKSIVINNGITSICAYAFYYHEALTSVTIPDSVTSIDKYAFSDCLSLTSVTIPNGVTTIGDEAFSRCYALTDATIGNSVTSIGNSAFFFCEALRSVTIGNSVTTIGNRAFDSCSSLTSVTIPDSVTSIGAAAFNSCFSLTSITIPDSVTSIGDRAFAYCEALTEIYVGENNACYSSDSQGVLFNKEKTELIQAPGGYQGSCSIPNTVTSIDDYAFQDCDKLTSVTIPDSVTSIGDDAFGSCNSLSEIFFCGDAPSIGFGAFSIVTATAFYPANNTTWTSDVMQDYWGVITWVPYEPENDEGIIDKGSCGEDLAWTLDDEGTLVISGTGPMTDYASASDAPWYSHRASILAIELKEGVTTVGDRAFYNCTALTDVSFSSTVSTIGTYAFRGCTALQAVTIPSTVTEVKGSAFRACTALTTVTFGGNAPAMGNYVFNDGADSLAVHRYEGTTGFDVAPWTGFTMDQLHVGQWIVDKEPTCTEEGSRHIDCAYCQETITETLTGGHNYVDGICTICQETEIVDSGSCGGNLTWKLDIFGNLTISGTGAMPHYYPESDVPWYAQRLSIKTIILEEGVTKIGQYAFWGCSNLTSITIPDNVNGIGNSALMGCTSLTSIIIPDSVTSIGEKAFYGCTGLASASIGNGVTTIANSVFYGCSSLESITIPDSVTSIGDNAFNGCSGLTSVYIPDSVTSIGGSAFSRCNSLASVTIPDSVTTIGRGAFYSCSGLESISIGSGITTIDYSAFNGCSSLTSITIPDSVTSIGECAFENCASLTNVSIPDSVTTIGYCAFAHCSSLESVTIPDSVTTIDGSAFYNCSSLTSVTIGSGVTSMGGYVFGGCRSLESVTIKNGATALGTATFSGCSKLTSITIPDSVTSIGTDAFDGCIGLTSVSLGNGIASIGDYAFEGCRNLVRVSIGNNVTSIGSYAFYQCESLTSVSIPDSVTTIGESAFGYCEAMEQVTLGSNVKSIGDCAFSICTALKSIVIPDSVESIGLYAFGWCSALEQVVIGNNVKSIGDRAFEMCRALTSIVIPDSVESIGANAFLSCCELKQVVVGSKVKSIGEHAFYCCCDLQSMVFKGDAPEFASNAFSYVITTCYYPAFNETWTADMMQNYEGTITWVSRYMDPVKIVTQPEDFVGMIDEMASFTVETDRDDVTYQWYFSANNGITWQKSSCTAQTLEVEFKAYRLNYLYRCEVTDADGNTVVSDAAALAALEMELAIVTQPENYVGAVNDDVAFTVEATGNGMTFQWFYSTDGGTSWTKSGSPGNTTATLQPILRAYRDGYQFYCQITDIFGNTVNSDVVSMAVKADEIVITSQPENVVNAVLSQLYYFTVEASGENLEYRWQVSSDGGETWQDSWNQGYNTNTLGVRMNANRDGNLYRCKITSGLKIVAYSDAVVLDMQDPSAKLIIQSGNIFVTSGTTATFTVDAEGMDLTYAWYRSNDKGATWIQTFLSGYNTNTLSFAASAGRAAMYMCKITDGSGNSIWSSPVKLQILSAELQILTQPMNMTCTDGETAAFTVEAQGDTLKYQWYSSADGVSWTPSYLTGYNTDTLSFAVTPNRASKVYKCVVTDISGNTVETDPVSVTIA